MDLDFGIVVTYLPHLLRAALLTILITVSRQFFGTVFALGLRWLGPRRTNGYPPLWRGTSGSSAVRPCCCTCSSSITPPRSSA